MLIATVPLPTPVIGVSPSDLLKGSANLFIHVGRMTFNFVIEDRGKILKVGAQLAILYSFNSKSC
jgi:hypothetical protein